MLSFACPINELKDYSDLFKGCKGAKNDEGKKAASLSINTYITNTEKESRLRKTGTFFPGCRKMFMI